MKKVVSHLTFQVLVAIVIGILVGLNFPKLLLGVDRFMSEARAITNLIGNGVASVVIAKSEKEFDERAYQRAINPKTADLVAEI